MILQLQKQLGAEKKDIEDLNKEIRDLKRNHYSELQKIENVHADKYRQLKQLVDQYRIQISGLEKVQRNPRAARQAQLASKVELTHIDTERIEQSKQDIKVKLDELKSEKKHYFVPPEQKDQVKDLMHEKSSNPFKTDKMNGFEIVETFDQLQESEEESEKTNRDFRTTYQQTIGSSAERVKKVIHDSRERSRQ